MRDPRCRELPASPPSGRVSRAPGPARPRRERRGLRSRTGVIAEPRGAAGSLWRPRSLCTARPRAPRSPPGAQHAMHSPGSRHGRSPPPQRGRGSAAPQRGLPLGLPSAKAGSPEPEPSAGGAVAHLAMGSPGSLREALGRCSGPAGGWLRKEAGGSATPGTPHKAPGSRREPCPWGWRTAGVWVKGLKSRSGQGGLPRPGRGRKQRRRGEHRILPEGSLRPLSPRKRIAGLETAGDGAAGNRWAQPGSVPAAPCLCRQEELPASAGRGSPEFFPAGPVCLASQVLHLATYLPCCSHSPPKLGGADRRTRQGKSSPTIHTGNG